MDSYAKVISPSQCLHQNLKYLQSRNQESKTWVFQPPAFIYSVLKLQNAIQTPKNIQDFSNPTAETHSRCELQATLSGTELPHEENIDITLLALHKTPTFCARQTWKKHKIITSGLTIRNPDYLREIFRTLFHHFFSLLKNFKASQKLPRSQTFPLVGIIHLQVDFPSLLPFCFVVVGFEVDVK